MNGGRRAMCIRAGAQDRRIAGLQRKAAGVGGHVGPAFVDDADDAERRTHALKPQSVGSRPFRGNRADRIRQRCHVLQARCDRVHARGIELEPIDEGPREPGFDGRLDVVPIGIEHLGRSRAQLFCRFAQGRVLGCRARDGEFARGRPRGHPEPVHRRCDRRSGVHDLACRHHGDDAASIACFYRKQNQACVTVARLRDRAAHATRDPPHGSAGTPPGRAGGTADRARTRSRRVSGGSRTNGAGAGSRPVDSGP